MNTTTTNDTDEAQNPKHMMRVSVCMPEALIDKIRELSSTQDRPVSYVCRSIIEEQLQSDQFSN